LNRRSLVIGATALAVAALAGRGDQEYVDPADPNRFGISPPPPRSILGVHTRLTDEVEPWKIQRTLEMVREMGAGWIVEFFPWAYVEPNQGEFDWVHPDLVVRAANDNGLEIIARIDFVPAWARPSGSTPRLLPPERWPDYAQFLGQFVRRYSRAIRFFVVWNEPNTSFEWGYQPVNPNDYAALLALASAAIRAANPRAIVLPAGLAPTLAHDDQAEDDLDFLQALYDRGAGASFDTLAAHAYGWKFPPADPAQPGRLNFARVTLLREVMVRNGDSAKSVLLTESGWNDSPRWTKAVHPGQRIQYTLDALTLATRQWSWLQALCLWNFRLPAPSHDYNDYFSLVDVNFRPKPIYTQLQAHAVEWIR
jgi:hypothetical protein